MQFGRYFGTGCRNPPFLYRIKHTDNAGHRFIFNYNRALALAQSQASPQSRFLAWKSGRESQ
jgi:hypothetical protein